MHFSEIIKELGQPKKVLSDYEKESLYSIAYGKYQLGDYAQAAEFFTHLLLQNPYELRYWKGLASSKQMEKDYDGALRAWGVLSLLGNHPPDAHFHAAECFLSKGEIEEAKKALECARLHLHESDPLNHQIESLDLQVRQ